MKTEFILSYPDLRIIAVHLDCNPHSATGLQAGIGNRTEVGVVLGNSYILVIKVIGNVVGRNIFTVLLYVFVIGSGPELALGLGCSVLGNRGVVRIEVKERKLVREQFLHLGHYLGIVREIKSRRFIADIYPPDSRMILEGSRSLFIF